MSAHQPLVSIITVTYNAASTVGVTLESVLRQEGVIAGADYEVVVVDGASKDNTLQIVNELPLRWMTVVSEPDKGIYDAMNKAMDIASGQYYMFLNAGDSLHSSATLSRIVKSIRGNAYPGVVYGQTNLVDPNRKYVGERHLKAPKILTYESFENGMLVCHQAFVALARIAPEFDMNYKFSADFKWCVEILQHSRNNVYIDDVIVDFLNEGTTTANRYASLVERFKIMCYYYGTFKTLRNHLRFIPRFVKSMIKR